MAEPSTDQPQTTSMEPSEPRRDGGGIWPLWLLALPFVYVLSVGPVARHYWHLTPSQPVPSIYVPLFTLAGTSQPLENLFGWYLFTIWHAEPGT
jgi:hypothetical protein